MHPPPPRRCGWPRHTHRRHDWRHGKQRAGHHRRCLERESRLKAGQWDVLVGQRRLPLCLHPCLPASLPTTCPFRSCVDQHLQSASLLLPHCILAYPPTHLHLHFQISLYICKASEHGSFWDESLIDCYTLCKNQVRPSAATLAALLPRSSCGQLQRRPTLLWRYVSRERSIMSPLLGKHLPPHLSHAATAAGRVCDRRQRP